MRDALAALALGIALKQLADLKKQHDENRLGKLRFGTRQKADAKRPDGRNSHQEMLVESLAMRQALSRFLERIETDEKIRNQIDEQQLPSGQMAFFLYNNCRNKQGHRNGDLDDLALQAAFMLVMMLMMMMFMFATFLMMVMMFVMVCHDK